MPSATCSPCDFAFFVCRGADFDDVVVEVNDDDDVGDVVASARSSARLVTVLAVTAVSGWTGELRAMDDKNGDACRPSFCPQRSHMSSRQGGSTGADELPFLARSLL